MFKAAKRACELELKQLKSRIDYTNSNFASNLLISCL